MASSASLLPPPGLEVRCCCHAAKGALRIGADAAIPLAFKGRITLRVEDSLQIGLGGRSLWLTDFAAIARSPVLGEVVLRAAEFDTTPFSLIELTAAAPPMFRETLFFDFTLSIETPPGCAGPAVLTNKATARLIDDRLTGFPPQGALHRLHQPIDLVLLGEPDRVVAQLVELPITVVHQL